jgi:hypothetical protein
MGSSMENSTEQPNENKTNEVQLNWQVFLSFFYNFFINPYWHYIAIAFLILRESFQCFISSNVRDYFKKTSNAFEMTLLVILVALSFCSTQEYYNYIDFLEVSFILFTTISASSILPFAYVPINMQILKKVALTFLRLFYTFAIILIAFSFSFSIMFNNKDYQNAMSSSNSSTSYICAIDNETKIANCTQPGMSSSSDFDDFQLPHTSLVKMLTMLSGEYSIEPSKLSTSQLLFFVSFVITSFILFNLILGLSIEDVQELKNGSRQFDLMTKTNRIIESAQKVFTYYRKYK